MDNIELLRSTAALMARIGQAAQKANEGITELVAAIANVQAVAPKVDALSVLTPRQKEIFDLIASETPVPDIARKLDLSRRTVEAHRDTIRRRLNFPTVTELNEYAKSTRTL